jgi:hypothetical protein
LFQDFLVFFLCRRNLRDIKLDRYFLCENINLRINEYSIQIMVEIGMVEIIGMGGNARNNWYNAYSSVLLEGASKGFQFGYRYSISRIGIIIAFLTPALQPPVYEGTRHLGLQEG